MKKQSSIYLKNLKKRRGISLIEMLITMAMSFILVIAVGTLLVGGNHLWRKGYESANSRIKQDAHALMLTFGSIGRRSNRLNYTLYQKVDDRYVRAVGQSGGAEQIVYGDAVEFRYWSADVPTSDMLDPSNTGTNFAFFYFDGSKLCIDYGNAPPGAIAGESGQRIQGAVDKTIVISENVIPDPNGAFSHTLISSVGQGCVRINVTVRNPDNPNEQVRVVTATLLRNIWPR